MDITGAEILTLPHCECGGSLEIPMHHWGGKVMKWINQLLLFDFKCTHKLNTCWLLWALWMKHMSTNDITQLLFFLVVDIHMFASSKTVYECYTNTMDSSHFIFFKCYARCVGLSGDFAHSVYNVFWLTIEYHFLHLSHTNAKFNWHLNETFFTIQFQVHLTHNIWAPKQMCLSNRTSWFWYDGKIAHNAASINDYMYMKALLTKFVKSQLVICYWINRMKKHKGIQTKC